MSNSPLVNYVKISNYKTSPRNHVIDTVTIHCTAGQSSIEGQGEWFSKNPSRCAPNYGIAYDGKIGLFVDEKDRCWCTSSASNDNRAVVIEVSSDKSAPFKVTEAAYNSLIALLTDICKRNGIKELKWKGDKALIGKIDQQNMTVHKWFAAKDCPGQYLYDLHPQIAKMVNLRLGVKDGQSDDWRQDSQDQQEDKPFIVRVTADVLNIRSGPGTSYAIRGKVYKGGAYTIVKTDGTWGYLKSGSGWISLNYAQKI